MDPVYGFSAVNVEAQQRNPGSFLHWIRGMLHERRKLPVLGTGSMEVLECPNPSVLAFVRSGQVADVPLTEPPGDHPGPATSTSPAPTGPDAAADDLFGATATATAAAGAAGAQLAVRAPVTARTVPAGEEDADEVVQRQQVVLCIQNLSRFAQPAELQLSRWAGYTPIEVLGRVRFPVIGEEPYTVTLGPYGCLWFDMIEQVPRTAEGSL
jgi:maltose alpha-D-glucosyltransferase/alpha-amylase